MTYDDINERHRARKEREQKAVDTLFTAIAGRPMNEQEQRALAWLSNHDFEVRQAAHAEYEQDLREQLDRLGVQLRIAHFTGDSSYPTEYTLRYSFVQAVGPTFDLALSAFIEQLLRHVPVEKALEQEPPSYDAIHTVEAYRREYEQQAQEKPPAAYLDDPTRVEPGWLGDE